MLPQSRGQEERFPGDQEETCNLTLGSYSANHFIATTGLTVDAYDGRRNNMTDQIRGRLAQKGNVDQPAQVTPYTAADKNSSGGENGPVVTWHGVTQSCV